MNQNPIAEWYLNIPSMFMDAEPESLGLNESRCDGNSTMTLCVKLNGKEHLFSQRFMWASTLQQKNFNVVFIEHPEFEWNADTDMSEEDQQVFESIQQAHKELLSLSFDKLEEEYQQAMKQAHIEHFA